MEQQRAVESWRENWAVICNERFKQKGIDERIDHRTLEAQNIHREPTIHVGLSAERKRENAEIIKRNEMLLPEHTADYIHELKQGYVILDKEIAELKQEGLQEKTTALTTEREEIKHEYQRQKLLAEIRADWRKICNRLKELAHKNRLRIKCVREDLARRRSESQLDTITERSFEHILKKILPKQAKALIERRAHEKEMQKEIDLKL